MVRKVKAGRWISSGSSGFVGGAGAGDGARAGAGTDFFIGSRATSSTGGGAGGVVDDDVRVAAGSGEQAARASSASSGRRFIEVSFLHYHPVRRLTFWDPIRSAGQRGRYTAPRGRAMGKAITYCVQ